MGARVWLWPNLLSLDAPLVALLWQSLFLRCLPAGDSVADPIVPAVLLAAAVWLIYAADRALDAWRGEGGRPRHEFYRRHWRLVLPVWSAVFAVASWLAWTGLPRETFLRGAGLGVAVAVYFAAVHVLRRNWPKEAAVALIFALGATLTAWNRIHTVADAVTVILFSCLCWINCVAIEHWEHGFRRFPIGLVAACVGIAAILALYHDRPILACAEASSAAAFVLLDRTRLKLSTDMLRVLADAALLSPVLFLPLVGLRF